jgi:hypothetical protein
MPSEFIQHFEPIARLGCQYGIKIIGNNLFHLLPEETIAVRNEYPRHGNFISPITFHNGNISFRNSLMHDYIFTMQGCTILSGEFSFFCTKEACAFVSIFLTKSGETVTG